MAWRVSPFAPLSIWKAATVTGKVDFGTPTKQDASFFALLNSNPAPTMAVAYCVMIFPVIHFSRQWVLLVNVVFGQITIIAIAVRAI